MTDKKTDAARMSHSDRRQRRRQISDAIANGLSIAEVASQFAICPGTVSDACREFGVSPRKLTKSARKKRRRQMSEAISNGLSLAEVASQFGMTSATVRNACREYGVKVSSKPGYPRESIALDDKTFAGRLRKGRLLIGFSQQAMDIQLGLPIGTFTLLEMGKQKLVRLEGISTLAKWCARYGISLRWLFTGEGRIAETEASSKRKAS